MTETRSARKRHSLRGQTTTLVAALAIPLLVLQAWWSFHDYRSARDRASQDALAFADAISLGLQQFVRQSEELLTARAEVDGAGWLANGDCRAEMASLVEIFAFTENALAVDQNGDIVCSAADVPPDAHARDWPWYSSFQASPRFLVGNPVDADFTGSWILPLVVPIVDESGVVTGALVGTVPVLELSRLLGGIQPPDEYLVTVATGDRRVITRSHDAERYAGDPLPPLTGSDVEVGPGRWVASGPDLTGVDRTWGQIEIGLGWVVYVGVPDDVVYGPARAEAITHIALTLFIVLVAMLLAGRSYARIASALRELARQTRLRAGGERLAFSADTPVEITSLVEQFDEAFEGRRRAEEAERIARERFESIFDNAVFGLFVARLDGTFLQVNVALAEMLGHESREALMGVGLPAVHADPRQWEDIMREAHDVGHMETRDLEWVRADQTPITVRINGKVIEGPDGDPVFEVIVRDVTDEKRTEDELRQTQKMDAIGQLAGGIAHDFNNLLTVIGGNVELLEDDLEDADPLRSDLSQIAKATRRATSLTRRLLMFSRRGKRGEGALDVQEVVPELEQMLVPLIGETVTLTTDLGSDPLPVAIDAGELEQILLNLVLNARDAMPRGGTISVTARIASCEETADSEACPDGDDDGVFLSVSDTGVGMDAATQHRIFEPFYTTKPMGKGTGLGLSTVYGIVRRARGVIRVVSAPDQGTSIEIWLPLSSAAPVAELREAEASQAVGTETVLVVEDDELVRNFVSRALSEAGFQVWTADDGQSALDLLRTRGAGMDVVLTDVVMPNLGGQELAERLGLIAPNVPILFMSGYVDNPFLSAELETNPEVFIKKPFSAAELRVRVRRILDRAAGVTAQE